MTIQEAINKARQLRSTELGNDALIGWLSNLDENLYERVLSRYGETRPAALPYNQNGSDAAEVELMLPERYTELYPWYLVMQIDLNHGDYDRYNNDALLYSDLEERMKRDYSREKAWKPPRPDGWPEDRPWDRRINIRF
jgi:hypothetical protein